MALWKPFLGNRSALDSVEKHAGYVYWCADDGSLHFDYTDAEGKLQRKQINAKDAETLTGVSLEEIKKSISWDDLTDRPFYAEPPVTTTTVLLPESTIEFEEGYYEAEMLLTFTENTEYTVTWDGVEYTSVSKHGTMDGINYIIFGNTVFMDGEDNGRPFMIVYTTDYNIFSIDTMDGVTASHTFSITKVTTTQEIHKLDDKYINAEWLPQKTMVPTVGVVETTMTVTNSGEDVLPSESYDIKALKSAEYYDVLWNGTTYKCVPQELIGITFIGNISIFDPTMPDSGEPFLFGCIDPSGVVPMVLAETEATFSITCYNFAIVSTIPHEYLPEPLQFGYEHEAEIQKEAITWDGDTTGRATLEAFQSVLNFLYHVSSVVPTFEDLCNGGVLTVSQTGMSQSAEFTSSNVVDMTNGNRLILSVSAPNLYIITDTAASVIGVPAGIYFMSNNVEYVSSFTINNYTFIEKETKIKTIDPKYLPEDIGGGSGSGLPEVTTEDNGKSVKVVDGAWSVEQMSYNDLNDKPTLFSGNYNDLSNKPTLGTLASKNSLSASDVGAVPTTRTINGKTLNSNISLSASDVGAVTIAEVNSAIEAAIGAAIAASY